MPVPSTPPPFILLFNGITIDGKAIATASSLAMLSSALGMAEMDVVFADVVHPPPDSDEDDTLVDSNCNVDQRLVFAGVQWIFCVSAFSLHAFSVFWWSSPPSRPINCIHSAHEKYKGEYFKFHSFLQHKIPKKVQQKQNVHLPVWSYLRFVDVACNPIMSAFCKKEYQNKRKTSIYVSLTKKNNKSLMCIN